jgi:ribosome-associated protein
VDNGTDSGTDSGRDGVQDVPVREEGIRLGQFLKLAGLAESGAHAKDLLAADAVSVNDEAEQRRGRQLRTGDVVTVGVQRARVVAP